MADDNESRWTVRGVPKAYQERAAKAASRRKLTLGAYVCQALDLMLEAEREPLDLITPADKTADIARTERPSDDAEDDARLARIERVVTAVVALAGARGVPLETRKQANRLLREHLPTPAITEEPRRLADQTPEPPADDSG